MKIRVGIAALLLVAAGCSSGPTEPEQDALRHPAIGVYVGAGDLGLDPGDIAQYSGTIRIQVDAGVRECSVGYNIQRVGDPDIEVASLACTWTPNGDQLVLLVDWRNGSPSEVLLDRVGNEGWEGLVWADLDPGMVHWRV